MHSNCYMRAMAKATVAIPALLLMFAAPAAVHAGKIMDALSPQARDDVQQIIEYSVVYDHCRAEWEMDDAEADGFVARLSQAISGLPQYTALNGDDRKVLLLNLMLEMQVEARSLPAPDCTTARVGGKRV